MVAKRDGLVVKRDELVAKRDGQVAKRDELVACSKCCDSEDLCNELLCGLPYKYYDATHCNSCKMSDHIRYSEDCFRQEICQSDEMCFSSTVTNPDNTLTHISGCKRAAECRVLAQAIFQISDLTDNSNLSGRSAPFCTVCCGDNLCNSYDCNITKDRLLALRAERRLNETTLQELARPYPGR